MSRTLAILSIHRFENGKENPKFNYIISVGINGMFYTNELCISKN